MPFEKLSKQHNVINNITFNKLAHHLDSFSLAVIKDIIQLCATETSPSGKKLSTKIIINQGEVLLAFNEITTNFVAKNDNHLS